MSVQTLSPSFCKEGGFIKNKVIIFIIIFFLTSPFFIISPSLASSPTVIRIEIKGNRVIKEKEIKKVILSEPEEALSIEKVKEDMQAIYDMGYFSSLKVLREKVAEGVILTYQVEEYPVVSDINFGGVENAGVKKKLEELVTLKVGEPWNYKKAQESKDKILDYLHKEGYTQAEVDFSSPSSQEESFVAAFFIDKGERARVMEIEISGNHFFSDPKLRSFMHTRFRAYFDPETLKQDIKKAITEYQKEGFYFASIDIKDLKFFNKYRIRWVRVFLRVNEGERFRMGKLRVSGNQIFSDSEIRGRIIPARGQIFNTANLKESVNRIKNMYGEKGYLYANIDTRFHFNPEEAVVDVELSVKENTQVRVGKIDIEGNKRTKREAFTYTLLLNSGDVFNVKKMIESWRRIYNLGFFEEVEMQPVETPSPSVLDLLIKVKEREKMGKLLLGASYSSNLGLEGFVRFSKDNLWGEGKMLGVDWEFGSKRNNYAINYLDRWWADTSTRLELNLYRKQHKFYTNGDEGYIKDAAGGEISLGRPWFSNFDFMLTLKREVATIKSIEGKTMPEDLKGGKKAYQSVRPAITWDSRVRDEAFNSYEGLYTLLSLEKSGGFLGGDADFIKYSAEVRSYFRYGKLWTLPILASRLRGKWGSNLSVDEQFHIGGQDTLRGYEFNEFRGSQALLGTVELRFPLTRNILSYLFVDAGKTSLMEEYKVGYGFGFKMNSPLGIIRLDYGISEKGESHFYFGMGDVF